MQSRFPEMLLDAMPRYAEKLDEPAARQRTGMRRRRFWNPLRWLRERHEVARLRRIESALEIGNWIYGEVLRVEHDWRAEVLAGSILYDSVAEKTIRALIRRWGAPRERILSELTHFASERIHVRGADLFRRNCEEARAIVEGRGPFFDDEENARRWEGVTSFMRPNVEAICVNDQGQMFDSSGNQIQSPGLEPEKVREARSKIHSGRRRTYQDIVAAREANGIRN
jgi:hypothetical protein